MIKAAVTPFQKFETTRNELSAAFIERDSEIDMMLTALVAKEHCLFVGPPGTAKSMLADALVNWLHGNRFSVLLSKYTVPEELFGPVSVIGLKEDKYRRIVTGKLPEADVAFIDEIFKASSAIANTTLTVLNERKYHNGDHIVQCPLKLCVAASNEWPGEQEGAGKELGALFDRFLFRKSVKAIAADKSIDRLLWSKVAVGLSTQITAQELDQASDEASALNWAVDAKEAFHQIRREAKAEGIQPGDRRLRKAISAVQAYSWLSGNTEVCPEDLEALNWVLWDSPEEQPRKLAEIVGKVANPSGMKVTNMLQEAHQLISKADLRDIAQSAPTARKLALILRDLEKVSGSEAAQAADYLRDEIKRIKAAAINSL